MIPVKVELIENHSVEIYRMASLDNNNKPLLWVSAFLIDGLLIDLGHENARNAFLDVLNIDNVEKCVLSHHHEDHIAASHDLINKYKIPVYANRETKFLASLKIKIPPERMLTWGLPKQCRAQELPSLKEFKTEKASFEIIPSPGHCFNIISFFHNKKELLFATDAFIDENLDVIFNWENANIILETVEKFKSYNPKYIFSSNGRVYTQDGLDNLINYWKDIKNRSLELYNEGNKTRQIVRHIFGRESWVKAATSGDMSRENLVRSLIGLPPLFKKRNY